MLSSGYEDARNLDEGIAGTERLFCFFESFQRMDHKFLEMQYRKKLIQMPLISNILKSVPEVKKQYELKGGHEISKSDAIGIAIQLYVFPAQRSVYAYQDVHKDTKTYADSSDSFYAFLHEIIETLAGVRDTQLCTKKGYEKVTWNNMKELSNIINSNFEFVNLRVPENVSTLNKTATETYHTISASIKELEGLKMQPLDVKRERLLEYIQILWKNVDLVTNKEELKNYGYEKGAPYTKAHSFLLSRVSAHYTNILSKELDVLMSVRNGNENLEQEMKQMLENSGKRSM